LNEGKRWRLDLTAEDGGGRGCSYLVSSFTLFIRTRASQVRISLHHLQWADCRCINPSRNETDSSLVFSVKLPINAWSQIIK